MSVNPAAAWEEVERRAAVSRFSGITSEDDDRLLDVELGEAMLNPNRQGNNQSGGMGGPGMMPPMMGGMGGGAGAGGAALAGRGLGATAAPPATPVQVQPAAGVGIGVQAAAAEPKADPGAGIPSGGIGGGMGAGGLDTGGLGGADSATSGAGVSGPPPDGFEVDPKVVRSLAAKWDELAQEVKGLGVAVETDIRLGFPAVAERAQQAVNQQVEQWRSGAASEFEALVTRLREVAGKYEEIEESGVAEAQKGSQE